MRQIIFSRGRKVNLVDTTLKQLVKSSEIITITLLGSENQILASAGPPLTIDPGKLSPGDYLIVPGSLTTVNLLELGPETRANKAELRDNSHNLASPIPKILKRSHRPPLNDSRPKYGVRNLSPFPAEHKENLFKRGIYYFVAVMSTRYVEEDLKGERWLRFSLAAISLLAALGIGIAWCNKDKSARLQLELLRTEQINANLEEKNLAAAGLAHETRNPLSIIRGHAQLITEDPSLPEDIKKRTGELIDEVDRITSRLNEFINYSRTREPAPSPFLLNQLLEDVARILQPDFEDKNIVYSQNGPLLTVNLDRELFRQVIFNLLINASQAAEEDGRIWVNLKIEDHSAILEICDNGPGVPKNQREKIFSPYISMSKVGTGLGLAVVSQIIRSSNLEIACLDSDKGGAMFRITGIPLVNQPLTHIEEEHG